MSPKRCKHNVRISPIITIEMRDKHSILYCANNESSFLYGLSRNVPFWKQKGRRMELKMTIPEASRLEVMKRKEHKEISLKRASEEMGISYKQTKQIWKRYLDKGLVGLLSKKRGKIVKTNSPEAHIPLTDYNFKGDKPLGVYMNNTMSKKLRKNIVRRLREEYIKDISDREFQERIWVKGLGPEVSSYEDLICDFFPLIKTVIKEENDYDLSGIQKKLLLDLYKMVDAYDETAPENDDEKIVNDPKWDEIRNFAKEVYDKLK